MITPNQEGTLGLRINSQLPHIQWQVSVQRYTIIRLLLNINWVILALKIGMELSVIVIVQLLH